MPTQNNKLTIQRLLTNPVEFEAYLDEIDKRLAFREVKIQARPLMAMCEISKELNCTIVMGDEFFNKLDSWYRQRYADRLLVSFDVGKMIVLIKKNPFLVRFPLAYGTVRVNPLEFIRDITPSLLHSLPKNELDDLANLIIKNYKACISISEQKFMSMPDMETAVNQIINQNPDYGQSKWASLQVSEKALKFYIKTKGDNPPNIHNLTTLTKQAESLGLKNIHQSLINKIQCTAGVRYGEENISLNDAVVAQQASIEFCEIIASNL